MNELDNRELDFCTDYRPAARYLYYHFVILMMPRRELSISWLMPPSFRLNFRATLSYVAASQLSALPSKFDARLVRIYVDPGGDPLKVLPRRYVGSLGENLRFFFHLPPPPTFHARLC